MSIGAQISHDAFHRCFNICTTQTQFCSQQTKPSLITVNKTCVASCTCWFTWFLDNSIAGVCYLLPFGLIWILVVVEVAINSTRVTVIKLISQGRCQQTGAAAVCRARGAAECVRGFAGCTVWLLEEIRATLWSAATIYHLCTLPLDLTSPSQPGTLFSKWSGFPDAGGRCRGRWWGGAGFASTPFPPEVTELVACSEWHLQQEDYSESTSLQVSLWFGSTSDRRTEQQRRDVMARGPWSLWQPEPRVLRGKHRLLLISRVMLITSYAEDTKLTSAQVTIAAEKKPSELSCKPRDVTLKARTFNKAEPDHLTGAGLSESRERGVSFLCSSDAGACVGGVLGSVGLSLTINSLEQFPELMVLAGLHRGTCCREQGVGRLLPGYRAVQKTHAGSEGSAGLSFRLLTLYSVESGWLCTQQQTQSYLITANSFFLSSLGQLVAVTTGFQSKTSWQSNTWII